MSRFADADTPNVPLAVRRDECGHTADEIEHRFPQIGTVATKCSRCHRTLFGQAALHAVGSGMPHFECLSCGERIAADSMVPDTCPNCGSNEWARE